MNVLFTHQNFPGQFGSLAKALAAIPGNRVVALFYDRPDNRGREIPGVTMISCGSPPVEAPAASHPWLKSFQHHLRYGERTAAVAKKLRASGFVPEVIVGHPGWGETLFLKDVWPSSRLIAYPEFFYHAHGSDLDFDPEFTNLANDVAERLRITNTTLLHALVSADHIWVPTVWQKNQLPPLFASRAQVIHDGIDTRAASPSDSARILLDTPTGPISLAPGNEVITFVNRNFDPLRGFHIFMRALPRILRARPAAKVILVGGDEAGYGRRPPQGKSWREVMLQELGSQLDISRVHFVGKIPKADYLHVLQVSALHIYLTYPFVLSWSLLEAMSVGCRILASNTAPVTEFALDGAQATLVDFFRPEDLAARAIDILENPQRYDAQRQAARNTIVARCDSATVCLPAQLQMISSVVQRSYP